jgi:Nif-specific regulatory protein
MPNLNTANINLSLLININEAISRNPVLEDSLKVTLQILRDKYSIKSGAIFLVDSNDHDTIRMAASIGYRQDVAKTIYKVGEGLTGRIIETGKPIIVPKVSKEPLFLNRMSSWDAEKDKEQTFIGVPIILDYRPLGALIINLSYSPKRDYDSSLKFIQLVASALLQSIRVQHIIQIEREKLINENVALKQKLQDEYSFQNIVGSSHQMRDVYEQVIQVARSSTTVLLRGESGTGKELIAEAIHFNSLREKNRLFGSTAPPFRKV